MNNDKDNNEPANMSIREAFVYQKSVRYITLKDLWLFDDERLTYANNQAAPWDLALLDGLRKRKRFLVVGFNDKIVKLS